MTQLAKTSRGDITKYDPDKGLKKIAFLEGAEKAYAKAKDATKLQQAIRAKLTAQAELVFWWDTKGPGAGHAGKRGGHRKGSGRKKSNNRSDV